MSSHPLDLLVLGSADAIAAAAAANGWTVTQAETAANAALCDAVLLSAPTRQALAELRQQPALAQAAFDSAVVVLAGEADEEIEADLLRLGVEAIVPPGDAAVVLRAIRHAVERKRLERATRTAYATDLATGLPHQAQLLEHMTQLLALREREPAPMVLIVLRVEGYAGAAAKLGSEAANILRRKVAVRLRSALRASDVVAAMGPTPSACCSAMSSHPATASAWPPSWCVRCSSPSWWPASPAPWPPRWAWRTPGTRQGRRVLLQRASAQAGSLATLGRDGFAARTERGPGSAANDDPV